MLELINKPLTPVESDSFFLWLHSPQRDMLARLVEAEIDRFRWQIGVAQSQVLRYPNMEKELPEMVKSINDLVTFLEVLGEFAKKEKAQFTLLTVK